MHWYCFRSQQKREHVAATHVRQSLGLTTYSPFISYLKVTRRGKVRFTEAMFSGYVFIEADLCSSLHSILRTTGITGAVRYGEAIPAIETGFIESLRQTVGNRYCDVSDACELHPSDCVRVVEGPFSGIIGKVLSSRCAEDRVRVLIDLLGQEIELSLPRRVVVCEGCQACPE